MYAGILPFARVLFLFIDVIQDVLVDCIPKGIAFYKEEKMYFFAL
jgi:hypothetical protein